MTTSEIIVRGAREHNLRDVNLKLPRGNLICFTGVSGSGKSSLAFDTLYAEGQRRYVESLSNYARQFMGQMPKPDVDLINGLSPSISISQKSTGNNPRSTVGTITEINDFLRVLYTRVGTGHCPQCGTEIAAQTREAILGRLQALPHDRTLTVLAPLMRRQKGEFRDLFEDLRRQGYGHARVDGDFLQLADPPALDRQRRHDVEAVIERFAPGDRDRGRLAEAVDSSLKLGDGILVAHLEQTGQGDPEAEPGQGEDLLLSSHDACPDCGRSYPPPTPQLFSFNSPQGMCPSCDGLGHLYTFVPHLLIPDERLSIRKGAVSVLGKWGDIGRYRRHIYTGVGKWIDRTFELAEGTALTTSWRDLPEAVQAVWLWGTEEAIAFTWRGGRRATKYHGEFNGLIPELLGRYRSSKNKMQLRQLERYMDTMPCPDCRGARLNPQACAVTMTTEHPAFEQPSLSLPQVSSLPIDQLAAFFERVELSDTGQLIAGEVLKEIRTRVGFLRGVGLDYLALARTAPTLSGGESQRIRLAGQIGSGLVGVLYILDEPSIGLHPRDNDRLIETLLRLRDAGNTLIVVEHDEDTMRAADMLVDFGPGPGVKGGQVVASGDCETVAANRKSVTGRFLAGVESIEIPQTLRPITERQLIVRGATHHNLKGIDVALPLGTLCCVTGVSGSGKSSLIGDILEPVLRNRLNGAEAEAGEHDGVDGIEHLDKTITIDQSPIGRTPRSNPATYVKVFDEIRNLFAQLPEAKTRGYTASRFSFNVEGGRCSACDGNGANKLEMDFMADVWVVCPVCQGKRYNRETLAVLFKGHSIAEVLDLDISQALKLFNNVPKIATKLQTLVDVGLEYLKLGQPSPTLSGGEAQRIKLSRELSKRATGRTLYILDEPTTGLHFADIRLLLKVLHGLVDRGNSVLVVEHNQDVIKTADWIVDLGPEGGAGGGRAVAAGTPQEIAAHPDSYTGHALAKVLGIERPHPPTPAAAAAERTAGVRLPVNDPREITVEGASQHNLKSVDVKLPRDAMTVFCGPSGSGKSSLAMHTIYAEGQRRYVESLSSYARQFIGQVQKPKAERIEGLSPAVALEQKNLGHSPRSTVGTVTEIYDYLRILMARLGTMYCPDCQIPVGTQTSDQVVEKVMGLPEGTRLLLLAPLAYDPGQDPEEHWDSLRKNGFARIRVDGTTHPLDNPPTLDVRRTHRLQVVVDRIVIRAEEQSRIADSVELALGIGAGVLQLAIADAEAEEPQWTEIQHSQHLACEACGRSFMQLTPHHFSFNSIVGWCPQCEGLGTQTGTNPAALLRDPTATLNEGAALLWPDLKHSVARWMLQAFARSTGVPLDQPLDQMSVLHRRLLYHGTGERWFDVRPTDAVSSAEAQDQGGTNAVEGDADAGTVLFRFQFKGFYPALEKAARLSPGLRGKLEQFVDEIDCSACSGTRLREEAAAVRFQGLTIGDFVQMPLDRLAETIGSWKLDRREKKIAGELVREIKHRTKFLLDVGLDYLTIGRPAATLSGGEAQRIRLAAQLGSGLCGVLYVLDEPTIGLHPRDNHRLLGALHRLRDLGNTLLVVEHDHDVIAGSDYLCDFGPGAGRHGGTIVAEGPPTDLKPLADSVTAPYIDGAHGIPYPTNRRPVTADTPPAPSPTAPRTSATAPLLTIRGAREHNLRDVTVSFPLGALIAVTGPSGSGKSSLIDDILHPHLARTLHRARLRTGRHDTIEGVRYIDKVIQVDQSSLGNTPSSNPATYTGVFDLIRSLFSRLPEAQQRRYTPRMFSFNVPGGRCDACEGSGQRCIEMHFLPDVWVPCEDCGGKRYQEEVLEVQLHGHSIADVLALPCGEAVRLFADHPKIVRVLQTICDVGLDYVRLGQAAPTLSGGEAQRVKLAAELARPDTGKTLYLLDEPTTGLHFDDIKKLLSVLHRLVDAGNTVIVIEHNLDVIKCVDWIIDMGPEAGAGGGQVVVTGTPEDVAAYGVAAKKKQRGRLKKHETRPLRSYTGEFLAEVLQRSPRAVRSSPPIGPPSRPRPGSDPPPEGTADGPTEEPAQAAAFPPADRGDAVPELAAEATIHRFDSPWRALGRKWHTLAKGFPDGTAPVWPLPLAEKTLSVLEHLVGAEALAFEQPDRVTVRPPGSEAAWAEVITKTPEALQLKLDGPADAIDLSLLQTLGIDGPVSIGGDGKTQVTLNLTALKHVQSRKLQSFLKSHLTKSALA